MSAGRTVAVVGVLGTPVVLMLLGVLILGSFMSEDDSSAGSDCGDSSSVVAVSSRTDGLTSSQLANVQSIVDEGKREGVPTRAVLIALAAASQESHFTNYANDGQGGDLAPDQRGIAGSLALPHEAVGSDHGSLGVFQQQWPWWGSMTDLMTPARAASKFYAALLKVVGWQGMTVTEAAQAVQSSAYPDAYADDEAVARDLLGLSSASSGVEAAATSSTCESQADLPGDVVFPLPANSGYRDDHNFGGRGGHWASVHTGDDFSVACGTPVLAVTDGTVVVRTDQSWAGPWLVQVSTGTGQLTTWYAHMRRLTVASGEHVTAGEQIGEVGDLGNATGCHLHLEVHPHGGSIYRDDIDPSAWLKAHVGAAGDAVRSASWTGSSKAFTVATFNTLGSSHTGGKGKEPDMASGPTRTRGVVEVLEKYGVDVVGFQEFQSPQADAFRALARSTYAIWSPPGDTENSIAYRRDRWQVVGTDTVSIPYFNGRARRMPIVQLRDRRTEQVVTFLNVHNPADTRQFPHQGMWRDKAVAREVVAVREIAEQNPVVMTGDLNDRRAAFCALSAAGGLVSSSGGSGAPCQPAKHAGIDWILGSAGVQFSDHTVDRDSLVRETTDHPVVLARALVEQ